MAEQRPTVEKTMVVEYVQPEPRRWDKADGTLTLFFVTANFADGSEGAIGVTQAHVDSTLDALRALKDAPSTFKLSPKDDFQGRTQWTIKDFPGKPEGAGGGGGGGNRGGGGMSHNQAGVLAAASLLGPIFAKTHDFVEAMNGDVLLASTDLVLEYGKQLADGLRALAPPKDETKPEGNGQPAAPAASSITLPQMQKLKELGEKRGLQTIEAIAKELQVGVIGELTSEQAATAIEAWGG